MQVFLPQICGDVLKEKAALDAKMYLCITTVKKIQESVMCGTVGQAFSPPGT